MRGKKPRAKPKQTYAVSLTDEHSNTVLFTGIKATTKAQACFKAQELERKISSDLKPTDRWRAIASRESN